MYNNITCYWIGTRGGRPRGSPNCLMRENNQTQTISAGAILEADDILHQFTQLEDPLRHSLELVGQREMKFKEHYTDFSRFFYTIVNRDNRLFCEGLLFLIRISKHLEASIV